MERMQTGDLPSRIVECVPVLRDCLSTIRVDWSPDELPTVVALGALGRCLVERLSNIDDTTLQALADLVEDVFANASVSARDQIATGFLEAILNENDETSPASRFLAYLGPLAQSFRQAWDAHCGIDS